MASDTPSAAPSASTPTVITSTATPPVAATVKPMGGGMRLMLSLVAGLAAGLLAFLAIDRFVDFFALPPDIRAIMAKNGQTVEDGIRVTAAVRLRDYRTSMNSVAILGACLAGLLGLAAGISRRSSSAALIGLIPGTIAGAVGGALGGAAGQFVIEQLRPALLDPTLKTTAAHAAAFVIMGVGAGLGAGLATKRTWAMIGAAAGAGLVAGLVFPTLAAVLFPVMDTDLAVPRDREPILAWALLPSVLMALAAARVVPVEPTVANRH